MALVLTSCTNRKRLPPVRALTVRAVSAGALQRVAADWAGRLRDATPTTSAPDLYCGRAFRQAEAVASRLRATLMVVSAGLGLVPATTLIPSYSLTVVPGSADSILNRISGSPTPSDWWQALERLSPFGVPFAGSLKHSKGPILIALSGPYLSMIAENLEALPKGTRGRLRIFTLSPRATLPNGLRSFVMPYDARFDGTASPMPGTRGDFAQRALAHFVETVLEIAPKGSFSEHADAVESILSHLRPPKPISRTKASDDEIIALIHRYWTKVDGRSSRMLRYLRDDLQIACEQSRFQNLFRVAKGARA